MRVRGITTPHPEAPRLLTDAASGTPMGRRLRRLRAQVRDSAENRPGIYFMYDANGALIYVGKSVRVRSRLLSYFRSRTSEKAAEILRRTERIDWEPQPSEFAALLREMRLIRGRQPPHNVQHRRDPGYSFVKVTADAAPRLTVTTRVEADGATYYGPLRGRAAVRAGTRELADLLKLRDCPPATPTRFRDQAELFQIALQPECVRAELNRCLAPCARRCGEADYAANVAEARAFLEGRSDGPLAALEERMKTAARRTMFEHAALLRDRTERLRKLRDQLRMLRRESRELSVVYRVPGHGGEDRIYLLVRGTIAEDLPAPRDAAGEERLRAAVARLARRRLPPLHSFDAERLAELRLVLRWFDRNPEEKERAELLRPRRRRQSVTNGAPGGGVPVAG
ncbi:MAG: GIY-YIG nuclease family protein [Gemmatimonadota bacterium]